MTAKELKRLRRSDLLEMLLQLRRENDQLRQELEQARADLQSKTMTIEQSGSLAEAVLKLNGVFEAAQEACDQYTLNVQQRCQKQEEQCRTMEAIARDKCNQMIIDAALRAGLIRGKTAATTQDSKETQAEQK